MVEGMDGEKVWVCRKLCREVERVCLGERLF
jgi:hypothetical protein